MKKLYLSECGDLNLRWFKLAIHIGIRKSRSFYDKYREDFYQTCLLAALECEGRRYKEARRIIQHVIYYTLKAHGYHRAADGYTWVSDLTLLEWQSADTSERLKAIGRELRTKKPECGVSTCSRESSNNDPKYGRLCARCFLYVNKRKRKGMSLPYDYIEENATGKHKQLRAHQSKSGGSVGVQSS